MNKMDVQDFVNKLVEQSVAKRVILVIERPDGMIATIAAGCTDLDVAGLSAVSQHATFRQMEKKFWKVN